MLEHKVFLNKLKTKVKSLMIVLTISDQVRHFNSGTQGVNDSFRSTGIFFCP